MAREGRWQFGLGHDLGRVFWGMVFVEGAFGAYMSVWPLWIEALGAPITTVGLVLGASGFLRLGAIGPAAGLAERFGTRRVIIVARSAAGIGMISAALATHWTHLLIMVLGASIGEAAFPLAQSHVVTHAGAHRVRAFTIVFTVGPSVALAVSPLISGALVAVWGTRAAFVLAGACTAASIFSFSGIDRGPIAGDANRPVATYRSAMAHQPVRRLVTLQFAAIFTLALGTSFIPTFLQDIRGYSPAMITVLGAGAAVGSASFGLVVARTVKFQRSPLWGVAAGITSVAVALLIFIWTGNLWVLAPAFILRGGFFTAWALFVAALGDMTPGTDRARVFAVSEMLGGVAFSSAPILAGFLYARRSEAPLIAAVVLAAMLVPIVVRTQSWLSALLSTQDTSNERAPVVPSPPEPVM